MTSPPKPQFSPYFCPAYHTITDRAQYIVQLNPPFQFVGLISANLVEPNHPFLHIHVYPKPGWPNNYPGLVHKMEVQLLQKLEVLFPDLSENIDAQVIQTNRTTCALDPNLDYLYCESKSFGSSFDTLVHVPRPWMVYAVTSENTVRTIYSECPYNKPPGPGLKTPLAQDPLLNFPTYRKAQAFLDRFTDSLDQATPETFID